MLHKFLKNSTVNQLTYVYENINRKTFDIMSFNKYLLPNQFSHIDKIFYNCIMRVYI